MSDSADGSPFSLGAPNPLKTEYKVFKHLRDNYPSAKDLPLKGVDADARVGGAEGSLLSSIDVSKQKLTLDFLSDRIFGTIVANNESRSEMFRVTQGLPITFMTLVDLESVKTYVKTRSKRISAKLGPDGLKRDLEQVLFTDPEQISEFEHILVFTDEGVPAFQYPAYNASQDGYSSFDSADSSTGATAGSVLDPGRFVGGGPRVDM